jgi:predicted regulator of Ras-like GTPase activity (Roadblock/LC7/MglB family)
MNAVAPSMQTLLGQLNTVPGVVGSMLCDSEGRVLAQAFPPYFDEAILLQAAEVLADAPTGLESVTGKMLSIELRFAESRVVLKPLAGAHLVLLCTAQANPQLLNISTSVAVPKLEKLVAAHFAEGSAPAPQPSPTQIPPPAPEPTPAPTAPSPIQEAPATAPEEFTGYEKTFVKLDSWLRKHMK